MKDTKEKRKATRGAEKKGKGKGKAKGKKAHHLTSVDFSQYEYKGVGREKSTQSELTKKEKEKLRKKKVPPCAHARVRVFATRKDPS